MSEPDLIQESPHYEEKVSRCGECGSRIVETIPVVAGPYYRKRDCCHKCLARYYANRGTRIAEGAA